MLEIRGLTVAYGESQVLWDVSLDVPDGGVVCLMGRNGVGKSTLLKTVMGLLPTRSGRIAWDGVELRGRRPEERVARGIGYVPQGREIFPTLTVAENLRVGHMGRRRGAPGDPGASAERELEQVFDLFPKLEHTPHIILYLQYFLQSKVSPRHKSPRQSRRRLPPSHDQLNRCGLHL